MDGTMCEGINCPKKDSCYRHTANANPWRQSYFMNVPYNEETKECNYFWPNKEEEEQEK